MKPIYILIAVAIFFALIGIYFYANPAKPPVVTTFAECEKTGYPVMESFPRKCQPAEGNAFIDYVSFKEEIVFADAPTKEGAIILDKDNPSGLPENADQIFIPIRFR